LFGFDFGLGQHPLTAGDVESIDPDNGENGQDNDGNKEYNHAAAPFNKKGTGKKWAPSGKSGRRRMTRSTAQFKNAELTQQEGRTKNSTAHQPGRLIALPMKLAGD
jgi:hypothetical protein